MTGRPTLLLILLLTWAGTVVPAAAQDRTRPSPSPPQAPPAVSSLTGEEAAALARELAPKVEELRGLKFKSPVPVKVVDDAAARDHFKNRMKKFWPEEMIRAEQIAYTQLGLLPAGSDLVATMLSILEEQVGGYYDPETDTFFVLGDMPRSTAPMLMVHELTHALDDQHYDIDALIEKAGSDPERSGVVGAVVEGSGTLVMTRYLMAEMRAGRVAPGVLKDLAGSEAGKAERLRAAPQVLQRGLLASYILGQAFILRGDPARLLAGAPPADLERLFTDPPVSTEQLLHPRKYWDESAADAPRPVALPDLSAQLGDGWKPGGQGNMGELVLAALTSSQGLDLSKPEASSPAAWTNQAAGGWGGDSYQIYLSGDRQATVVATLWDTTEDAEEFEAALAARWSGSEEPRRGWRRGDAVVIVAGDAGDRAAAVAQAALASLATP